MTVTRQQFLSLLEPKLRDVMNDQDFPRAELVYPNFYGTMTSSKKATETDFERAGLGDFSVKAEGGLITYTDPIAGVELASTHVRRSNGYKITQEMLDHDQYAEIVKLERDLQIAGQDDLEITGHLLLNNGFSGTDVVGRGFHGLGFDSLALFSTAHTRLDGGANQANRPATDVVLGWTALADAQIQFNLWRDHRGRPVRGTPAKLVVHPNDELTAREIMESALKPGTANNDKNVIGRFQLIVSQYITSTDDWFLLGNDLAQTSLWYWDVQPRTAMEDDFDREIIKRKRVHGSSCRHARWFNAYGSSGAA